MDTINALSGSQAYITACRVNGEGIFLQRERRDGIFFALIIGCLAIVFVKVEAIVGAGEHIQIKFLRIIHSTPVHFWRERDDRSRLSIDRDILEPCSDCPPPS